MNEHDYEPVPGLPERLPPNERVLWRGAPSWRALARRSFHAPMATLYFGVLIAWRVASGIAAGQGAHQLAVAVLILAGLGMAVTAMIVGFSWLVARTTIYTITNKRVVMRVGIALPMTANLPFAQVESAGLRTFADGRGNILLSLLPTAKAGYLMLFPHVRPGGFTRVEPMLLGVPKAAMVAQILARALAAETGSPVQAVPETSASVTADQRAPVAA